MLKKTNTGKLNKSIEIYDYKEAEQELGNIKAE